MVSLDERILLLARTRAHGPSAERALARLSRLGEHGAVWLALGALGARLDTPERRSGWRRASTLVAGAYVANTALKLVVRRRRPELAGLPPLTGTPTRLSFPSAHATTSFTAAGLYARLGLPPAPLYALAGALALSRLYLGVHHPSDVLAGALLGATIAAVAGDAVVGGAVAAGGAPVGGGAAAGGGAVVGGTTGDRAVAVGGAPVRPAGGAVL